MAEPTSTATLAAATLAVPVITAGGIPLGIRPDLLLAGFSGAIVAIILLNSVPSAGDTWSELLRTTLRRICVSIASALTAGYLAPMVMSLASLPDSLLLGGAFAVGAGAQRILVKMLSRVEGMEAGGVR